MATGCPEHLRKEFLGEPTHITLGKGEVLYKFVSFPIDRNRVLLSPWWIRQRSFDELMAGARGLGLPTSALVRSRLAITAEWNPGMDAVATVVLGATVGAWEGRARRQRLARAEADVLFTGGGWQLAVPDLSWREIATSRIGTPAGPET